MPDAKLAGYRAGLRAEDDITFRWNVTPCSRSPPRPASCTLLQFDLPSQPGNERQAASQVLGALKTERWRQIAERHRASAWKTAVGEAT
jgi:hypothetical protein